MATSARFSTSAKAILLLAWIGVLVSPLHYALAQSDEANVYEHGNRSNVGPSGEKYIALTFDLCSTDGALLDQTVVKALSQNNVPATFFASGMFVQQYEQEMSDLASNPNFEIEAHSWDHPNNMSDLFDAGTLDLNQQITATNDLIEKVTGKRPQFIRLPAGNGAGYDANGIGNGVWNDPFLKAINATGTSVLDWDVVSADPYATDPNTVYSNVVNNVQNGSIVVMHGNGKGTSTAAALQLIIPKLREQGYTLVTVAEMQRLIGLEPRYGQSTSVVTQVAPEQSANSAAIQSVLGYSAGNRPIPIYRWGNGSVNKLIVCDIHGGYERNTYELCLQIIEALNENSSLIPVDVTLYLVPSLNPDGLEQGTRVIDARVNDNGVDLNRNWPYEWKSSNSFKGQILSAGTEPLDQPETKAVEAFIREKQVESVVFYHSTWGVVFSNTATNASDLGEKMAEATGYRHVNGLSGENGEARDYLGTLDIPALEIELTSWTATEFDQNWPGVLVYLGWKSGKPSQTGPDYSVEYPFGQGYQSWTNYANNMRLVLDRIGGGTNQWLIPAKTEKRFNSYGCWCSTQGFEEAAGVIGGGACDVATWLYHVAENSSLLSARYGEDHEDQNGNDKKIYGVPLPAVNIWTGRSTADMWVKNDNSFDVYIHWDLDSNPGYAKLWVDTTKDTRAPVGMNTASSSESTVSNDPNTVASYPAQVHNGESLTMSLFEQDNRIPIPAGKTILLSETIDPNVQIQLVQILNGQNGLEVTIVGNTVVIKNPTNTDLAIFGDSSQGMQIWVEEGELLSQGFLTSDEITVERMFEVASSMVFDEREVTIVVGGKNYAVALWVVGLGFTVVVLLTLSSYLVLKKKGKGIRIVVSLAPEVIMILFVLVVIGPPPYEVRLPPTPNGTTTTTQETQEVVSEVVTEVTSEEAMLAWGKQHGIGEENLLANIAASSVCWSNTKAGKIVEEGSPELCTKVDLLTLLSIDATESTDKDVGVYDPTKPGVMGYQAVEKSAETRWGADKMKQLDPIWEILMQPEMRERYPTAITDVNGNEVYEPSNGDHINVYGSSATCIGRSQGLPSSIQIFAWDLVEDPNLTFDPWNDEVSSAMFKAAHLAHSYKGETLLDKRRNAIKRYNPGAADLEWAIASKRLTQLGDIPTTTPQVTTRVVRTVITIPAVTQDTAAADTRELFRVLYSTSVEHTPLEYLIAFARIQRGREEVTPESVSFWERFESTACNISWGFAARPCWQEVNK